MKRICMYVCMSASECMMNYIMYHHIVMCANSLVSVASYEGTTVLEPKVKPERPPRPSDNPPVSPKPDISPPIAGNATAIYASPFGRPPVVVKKPTPGTEALGLHDYAETLPRTPKKNFSTGVDSHSFQEYSESGSLLSVPTFSYGTPVYAEIESTQPKTPTSADSSQSQSYEYADPNAMGKWSLQHIARGNPVECEYATLPDDGASPTVIYPGQLNTNLEH